MPITVTALAAATATTTNATSYAGTAGTPAAGDLLICFVSGAATVGTGTMTGTWTWTRHHSFTKNSGLDTLYVFWAEATAATSTTPTFDCSADAAGGCAISCFRIAGHGGTPPYIRQMKTATGTAANPAVTMDSAILTTNAAVSLCVNGTNSAAQFTAPTGWTEVHEVTHATPSNGIVTGYRASGETGTVITWTNANTTAWGLIVLEITVASVAGDPLPPLMMGSFSRRRDILRRL